MRDSRQIRDRLLEDAVGAGVGDHDRTQIVFVFFGLRFKIVEVDVAGVVGLDLCESTRLQERRRRVVSGRSLSRFGHRGRSTRSE